MAAANLSNSDIVKGSVLMVFIGDQAVGFATSHTLNITTSTTEIVTKDHGDYPGILPQTTSWEITAENLYSDAGEQIYMNAQANKTLLTVKFAKANNWTGAGIVGIQGAQAWAPASTKATGLVATGNAYLTSFSINAPAGENATMSVTLTGVGALTIPAT